MGVTGQLQNMHSKDDLNNNSALCGVDQQTNAD